MCFLWLLERMVELLLFAVHAGALGVAVTYAA